MHKVLVNHLGGLSLPRKSVVRLTDRPDMTLDVYHGCKSTKQQQQNLLYRHYFSSLIITYVNFYQISWFSSVRSAANSQYVKH